MRLTDDLSSLLFRHIDDRGFPCVGAKAARARRTLETLMCDDLAAPGNDREIHDRLLSIAAIHRQQPALFRSLAIVFRRPGTLDELAFEAALWTRLQALSNCDVARGHRYHDDVSADPDSSDFSMSFGGEAFFVVGLHPAASRPGRRFAVPVLVFNPHDQFETLRATGKYEPMRAAILTRDHALAGSVNPMLARHGERSEARQYSGRAVDEAWQCPFRYAGAA